MKISEKIVRLTIEKFSDALQTCADRKYSNKGVVAFFGKKRAINWCGSWNGYPDVPIILWYEKRYKRKFQYPHSGKYFDELRYFGRNFY